MKRFITVLLVLSMVIGLVPAFAVSAAEETSAITIDGKIDDWAGLHTVGVVSDGELDGKKVTFYGKLTEQGLYLAADAYHGTFTTTENDWWRNTNFEVFINRGRNNGNQNWLSAKGMGNGEECKKSNDKIVGKMINESVTDMGAAKYHTVAEMFFPAADFAFVRTTQEYGTINVGMAWKTVGDRFNNAGTQDNGVGTMEWVFPVGSRPDNNNKLVVTAEGVFTEGELYDKYDFIAQKAEWSYLTATQNPDAAGEGWNTTVNTAWAKANAPFGNRAAGATNAWGTTDNPNDGTQNNAYLWVAKEFTVEDINALEGVSLFTKMYYDDTINLYVNGKLVYNHDGWNDGYSRYMLAYDASTILKEGKNVIAASLQQHTGGYEFDLELYATNLPQDRNNNLPAYAYISTTEDLDKYIHIANILTSRSENNTRTRTVILENDLDYTGKEWTPFTCWKGILDGNGHAITGLEVITDATSGDYGLIVNKIGNDNFNGTVKNLTVADSVIVADKTNGYVGAIAGFTDRGKVENCTVENVTVIGGKGAGGIAGLAKYQSDGADTIVTNCTVKDTTVIAMGSTTGEGDDAVTTAQAAALVGAFGDTNLRVEKHTLENVIVKGVTTADLANPLGSNTIGASAEGSTTDVTKTDVNTIEVTEGVASTFNAAEPADVVIKTTASAMSVKKVVVNGASVDFTAAPGDAISVITLAPAAFAGLDNGEYDITIETYEGDLAAKVTVEGVAAIPATWDLTLNGKYDIWAMDGSEKLAIAEFNNKLGTLTIDGETVNYRGTLAENNLVLVYQGQIIGSITTKGPNLMIVIGEESGIMLPYEEEEPDSGLKLGENSINVTDAWAGVETTFTAPADGKYTIKPSEGETNHYVGILDEYGITWVDLPYEMELTKGQVVGFGISTYNEEADEINLVIETDAEIPETGDATLFIVLASVLSLGVAVVALKRRQSVR